MQAETGSVVELKGVAGFEGTEYTIRFKYLSKSKWRGLLFGSRDVRLTLQTEALQAMMLMPRTPSPEAPATASSGYRDRMVGGCEERARSRSPRP